MKPTLASVATSVLLAGAALAADPPATTEATCNHTATAPTIDGDPSDPCWAGASVIDQFPSFWDGTPNPGITKARLLWDDQALYFTATMSDAELKAFGTNRNDTLWLGDVFELFFKPYEDRPAYYEFQVNPRSVILELAFPRRGYSFEELAARPPMGFTAVARLQGTLDQPDDKDRSWTVEGRIPWTLFAPTGGRPAPGDTWRFALCRYDYGEEGADPILTSSAPLTQKNYHRYEDYGRLTFKAAVSGSPR
jgi:hypothetical protein